VLTERVRATHWVLAALAGCTLLAACSGQAGGPGPRGAAPPAELAELAAPTVPGHLPGYSTAVAPATSPGAPQVAGTAMLKRLDGNPFGIAVTADRRWSFVVLNSAVLVLRAGPGGLHQVSRVHLDATLTLAEGAALTPDGRYLLVADDRGADVISVARAEAGRPHAVLGKLTTQAARAAIEVAVSPDSRYVFISEEFSKEIVVFNLRQAIAGGFGAAGFTGDIPAGRSPVGLAVSPDGRWLYATSERVRNVPSAAAAGGNPGVPGVLEVISVRRAERDPARSVVSAVQAGYLPVRVITSADGAVVWVTARASDALLAYSAARLRSSPAHALLGWVRVGETPVGLALIRGGREIVIADSNRRNTGGRSASLAVVRTAAALAGRPAVARYVRAGLFPREVTLAPGGQTLLVSNYDSGELESVTVASLP
jgi:DNA-binding beta-propeller fold protein YncE